MIPTYNRSILLNRLITSIDNQELPHYVSLSILVVNDGSTDDTLTSLISRYPGVSMINGNGNWWWTKCINEGMRFAFDKDTDFVLWMNDDNELPNDYISKLISAYRSIPGHSILGSASISIETPRRVDSSGYAKHNKFLNKLYPHWPIGSEINADFKGVHPTCSLSGRGTLVPLSVFKQLGELDERLIQYGSDDDYVMRALKMNIPAFISFDAMVLNHTKLTSKERDIKSQSIRTYMNSFLNPHSANSLKKHWRIYTKHCVSLFAPIYLIYIMSTDLLKFILIRYMTPRHSR